jgi:hypothetical protein
MVTKPTNAHKTVKVSYIINIVRTLHVSATLVAMLREMCYKGWIYQDTAEVYEPLYQCEILSCNGIWFKTHINI